MKTIRDRITHAKGIGELSKASFDPNQQGPACMVGKANQQIIPRSREHAQLPLERVYRDIMPQLDTSIKGYNDALIIAEDASMCRWVYGLNDKSEHKWCSSKMDMRYITTQSATPVANIDLKSGW